MENKTDIRSNLGAISASLYVSFQVMANVLSTKIAVLPILHWAIDGGTIIYPLTFTLRDFVHKTIGKKNARHIVVLAGLVNLLMVVLFVIVGKLPADPSWPYQEAYSHILLPVWRITFGSVISEIVSELIDTEVFSWAYRKYKDTTAVLLSNTVALLFDSVVFTLIAFAFVLPWSVVGQIIVTNIIIKMIMSLASAPTIKLVPRTVGFEEI